jgi:hypothetical protein
MSRDLVTEVFYTVLVLCKKVFLFSELWFSQHATSIALGQHWEFKYRAPEMK